MHGYQAGWVAHTYRDKFKVWPRGIDAIARKPQSDDVLNFIKSKIIRNSYARRNTK